MVSSFSNTPTPKIGEFSFTNAAPIAVRFSHLDPDDKLGSLCCSNKDGQFLHNAVAQFPCGHRIDSSSANSLIYTDNSGMQRLQAGRCSIITCGKEIQGIAPDHDFTNKVHVLHDAHEPFTRFESFNARVAGDDQPRELFELQRTIDNDVRFIKLIRNSDKSLSFSIQYGRTAYRQISNKLEACGFKIAGKEEEVAKLGTFTTTDVVKMLKFLEINYNIDPADISEMERLISSNEPSRKVSDSDKAPAGSPPKVAGQHLRVPSNIPRKLTIEKEKEPSSLPPFVKTNVSLVAGLFRCSMTKEIMDEAVIANPCAHNFHKKIAATLKGNPCPKCTDTVNDVHDDPVVSAMGVVVKRILESANNSDKVDVKENKSNDKGDEKADGKSNGMEKSPSMTMRLREQRKVKQEAAMTRRRGASLGVDLVNHYNANPAKAGDSAAVVDKIVLDRFISIGTNVAKATDEAAVARHLEGPRNVHKERALAYKSTNTGKTIVDTWTEGNKEFTLKKYRNGTFAININFPEKDVKFLQELRKAKIHLSIKQFSEGNFETRSPTELCNVMNLIAPERARGIMNTKISEIPGRIRGATK